MGDKVGGGCCGEEMKRERGCASNWHTLGDPNERRVENSNKPLIEGAYPLTSVRCAEMCRIYDNPAPHAYSFSLPPRTATSQMYFYRFHISVLIILTSVFPPFGERERKK